MKTICLITGLLLAFSICCFGQKTDRIIDFSAVPADRNTSKIENGRYISTETKGVELVEITVEGKTVIAGVAFAAGDDWLKTLKIKLKNVSDKSITSIRLSFTEPEAKYKDGSLGFSFEFGSLSVTSDNKSTEKIIQPGEEFEMSQTEAQFLRAKTFVQNKSGVADINKIIIGAIIVKFENGDIWTAIKLPAVKKTD